MCEDTRSEFFVMIFVFLQIFGIASNADAGHDASHDESKKVDVVLCIVELG